MLYNILKHTHSGLRWIVLLLLIAAIVTAWQAMQSKSGGKSKLAMFAQISVHTQFLLGLILYFISPHVQFGEGFMKNNVLRFYGVEHITIMILAVVLITIGYSKGKRQADDYTRNRTVFRFYLAALILILLGIPWPFRIPVAGWF